MVSWDNKLHNTWLVCLGKPATGKSASVYERVVSCVVETREKKKH
jgi:hypothetical protein